MSLRSATFSATRWTTASSVVRFSLQFVQTAVLARLLTPTEFGLMALAGVVLASITILTDAGLNSALMHFPQPDQATLSTLYWLNIAISVALMAIVATLAWPISKIYEKNELATLLMILTLDVPIKASYMQFIVYAEKKMQFKVLAQNEIVAYIFGFAAAIILAYAGFGVYSIAISLICTTILNAILTWIRLSKSLIPSFEFKLDLSYPYIKFGLHRIGDGFWNTLRMQSDIFIVGLFSSAHTVACYTTPREWCLKIANTIINPVINRVALPALTQIQDEKKSLKLAYLKILKITASFNFPLYLFIAFYGKDVVEILLGDQWQDATIYMQIFAIWGMIRSTGNPSGILLYATGLAKRAHIWNFFLFLVSVPLIWFSASKGNTIILAWSMLIWQFIIFFMAWYFLIYPACDATFGAYVSSLAPPLCTSAISMAISMFAYKHANGFFGFTMAAITYGMGYFLISTLINKDWILIAKEVFHGKN